MASPQSNSSAPNTPTKPYTLYAGRNFAVQWKGKLRPVVDVQGNSFIVEVDGHQESVSSTKNDVQIKIDDAIKVTGVNATIDKFKAERIYTPGNDPRRRMQEAANMAMIASDNSDSASSDARTASMQAGFAAQGVNPLIPETVKDAAAMRDASAKADTAYVDSLAPLSASINSVADAANNSAIEASRELYDAFSLTFEVSCPQPLRKPYVVVVTKYHERPDQPNQVSQWVYAQALRRVDANPATFVIRRAGFSPGYTLDEVQLHLYDGETEVATNIARKRVPLTGDEAFQFSVVEYIQQHRGATLPLSRANHISTSNLRSHLSGDQLSRTVYIKVGKNGIPTGSYWNAACTEKVSDPELVAFLASMRFNPALNTGKPVEGVSAIALDSL